jgi:hypothetical protein
VQGKGDILEEWQVKGNNGGVKIADTRSGANKKTRARDTTNAEFGGKRRRFKNVIRNLQKKEEVKTSSRLRLG